MSKAAAVAANPLQELLVIDRLDVEVTRLERDKVTASYRVTAGGETRATEYSYRYGEPVFDPANPDWGRPGRLSSAGRSMAQLPWKKAPSSIVSDGV